MVTTKGEDVTKEVFCCGRGKVVGVYLSLSGSGRLFEAGRLLTFLPSVEVGTNSRLSAYSNKYGM